LHSILEETRHISGTKVIRGSIAYVEQEPFILPGSIKENILFGKVFDQELFDFALEASCLQADI